MTQGRRGWQRVRRIAGRTAIALLAFIVVCAGINLITRPAATFAATDGAFISVGSIRVHYLRWGDSGPAVVLVHGFAESGVSWTPTAAALARTHVVYALDLTGSGYTDRTGHYSLDDETDLVIGFVRALHLSRPLLVGHSMGAAVVGSVALRASQSHQPELLRGIIFLDGDGLPFSTSRRGNTRLLLRFPPVVTAYRVLTRWHWLDQRLVRELCGSRCLGVTPELVEAWMRPLRQGDAERALPAMADAGVLALTPEQEQQIAVPRGIVWGSEDATGGGSRADAEANLHHPQSITIEGAGHLSQVADPDAVAAAINTISATW